MPFTIPNEADASTYPAQSEPDSLDFTILAAAHQRTGVLSGCAMTATGSTMVLTVAAGAVGYQGLHIAVAGNTVTATADGSNPRWGLVTINSSGTAVITMGTAGTNPALPSIPSTSTVLYAVWVPAAATTLSSTNLVDKRTDIKPAEMLVYSQNSGSAGATISMTSIPSIYRHLRLVLSGVKLDTGVTNTGFGVTINQAFTNSGTAYLSREIYDSTTTNRPGAANIYVGYLPNGSLTDAAAPGLSMVMTFPNYTSTSFGRHCYWETAGVMTSTTGFNVQGVGYKPADTAAITRIDCGTWTAVNLKAGWQAQLYGVDTL